MNVKIKDTLLNIINLKIVVIVIEKGHMIIKYYANTTVEYDKYL